MRLSNAEMEACILALDPYLDRTDIIGFAAARAVKKLQEGCAEFLAKKQQLLEEYGEPDLDGEGNCLGTWSISPGSEGYGKVFDELSEYAVLTHYVDLPTLPVSEAKGVLSGREILSLGFLFEDGE